jgi:CBS domain-containing protein
MKSVRAIVDAQQTVTVEPSMSVLDAAQLMAAHHIGAVPVVDNDDLAGIFTERDVLARVVAAGMDPSATPIAAVMSTGLILADINETYEACLKRMLDAQVRHLVVVERGRLAGIVSLRDLMAVDLDEKDHAIALLHAYVQGAPVPVISNV